MTLTKMSLRVDDETIERVEKLAQSERRSISNMIGVLLNEALAARADKEKDDR